MQVRFLMMLMLGMSLSAEMKIAVVDLETAINSVSDGKEAKVKLQEEFKKKQDLLDKKQAELKKLQDTLQSQGGVMKEEARQTKMAEFQTKVAEAQQMYSTMQQDMVKRQQEVMGDILRKMNPIVADIAKKEAYTAVLNRNEATVLYIQPGLDITESVIQKYNAAYPSAEKKKKK